MGWRARRGAPWPGRARRRGCWPDRGRRRSTLRPMGRSRGAGRAPGHLVAHAGRHPHGQQRGVQRSVGLGERADRLLRLVRSGAQPEDVPCQGHHDQSEPRRQPDQGAPRPATSGSRPRLGGCVEVPSARLGPLPSQRQVDGHDGGHGAHPGDLRRRTAAVEAADPPAPGAERQRAEQHDEATAAHGIGLAQHRARQGPLVSPRALGHHFDVRLLWGAETSARSAPRSAPQPSCCWLSAPCRPRRVRWVC